MSGELAVIAGSSVAGAISAALIDRAAAAARAKKPRNDKQQPQEEKRTASNAKAELASLAFEKTLAAEAITRVYEAAQDGRIDHLERDRLLVKYKHDLDALNERIATLKPVAEYAELADMRNNLASLLENKISALDQKLAEMSKAGAAPVVIERVQVMPIPEKVRDDSEKKQFKAEEKSIEQLQKEIVQALTRLEQVELDKD
ncbi:hypothetical protein NTE_02163 [Candidatus Nitrososphaera evergladensis SR1]|jgi:hypothetical protein|uniref:Uncharacterized protein n=1 Tax=Candidatus Nitrososphaera evergladensis SR1 TaxID=1459636 RepID=A0A075MU15_9ARCH|nr:hypothetical protein [Candidatus Nitrososphaera evergladensis]AIF84217.1 hypothetical protein NTE_02163 [Candidatus Nitrososphaera evergladensis SR1]